MIAVDSMIAGKYRVRRLLGQGGMGAVYEGEHVEIGKRVAIKVIEPSHAGSTEIAARFKREARAASAVESDCIVHVFDVGEDPDVGLYMVMELLSGEDLSTRLARDGKLEVGVALAIGVEASRALAKAHAAGVVHRDLKPANLFLTTREDGSLHVKILDFGISKLVRPDAASSQSGATKGLTRAGTVMGTPQYMSPEQAQGLAVDPRTDVWSLAAVLYEALSGESAFPELATYEQTIIRIVTGRVRPLAEVAPHVPPAAAQAIMAALAHDLDGRLPDCAELAQRLGDALSGLARMSSIPGSLPDDARASSSPSSASRAASPATVDGIAVTPRPNGPRRIASVVVAAAVALIAVAAIVGRRSSEPGTVVARDARTAALAAAPRPSVVVTPADPTVAVPIVEPAPAGVPSSSAAPSGAVSPSSASASQAPAPRGPKKPAAPSQGKQIGGAGVTTEY